MMRRTLTGLFSIFLMTAATAAKAQMRCKDPAYRQFDFWLGEWEVRKPDGTLAGSSRIEKQYGGCVLHERYLTPGRYAGESLNTYDVTRKRWHQRRVDNTGLLLLLDGRLVDGRMLLQGAGQDAKGNAIKHRISWTPNPNRSVRQFWESTDASGKWTVAFDGTYTRK